MHLYRYGESMQGFPSHPDRYGTEQQGARVAGQGSDLARAEGIARIVGVATCEGVGEGGQPECADVTGHVPAIGQQRHRARQPAGDDLDHHGDEGQCHHPAGALLGVPLALSAEVVSMLPDSQIVCGELVHGEHYRRPISGCKRRLHNNCHYR